ncbi:MAG TPA: DUF3147 family protein, partial [Herpetosiphonaceae bacterium]|nr:DUF3147 family protein [Herpetosiphonaceae bacterium]
IIGGVNIVARRSPKLGGLLAAMPIISMLSVLWLRVDRQSNDQIADFLVGVLWGLVPTLALLAVEVAALRRGLSLWLAIGLGVAAWLGVTAALRWLKV